MDEDRILAALAEIGRQQRLDREAMIEFRTQVMDKFERMGNRLTGIQDDFSVAMASSSTATRLQRDARTDVIDLFETMNTVHRQIRRLRTEVDELKGNGPRGA